MYRPLVIPNWICCSAAPLAKVPEATGDPQFEPSALT
jgi:hypothetical protein